MLPEGVAEAQPPADAVLVVGVEIGLPVVEVDGGGQRDVEEPRFGEAELVLVGDAAELGPELQDLAAAKRLRWDTEKTAKTSSMLL